MAWAERAGSARCARRLRQTPLHARPIMQRPLRPRRTAAITLFEVFKKARRARAEGQAAARPAVALSYCSPAAHRVVCHHPTPSCCCPHPLLCVPVYPQILEGNADPSQPFPSVWSALPAILGDTARLAGVGAGVGLAMSIALGYLLR